MAITKAQYKAALKVVKGYAVQQGKRSYQLYAKVIKWEADHVEKPEKCKSCGHNSPWANPDMSVIDDDVGVLDGRGSDLEQFDEHFYEIAMAISQQHRGEHSQGRAVSQEARCEGVGSLDHGE